MLTHASWDWEVGKELTVTNWDLNSAIWVQEIIGFSLLKRLKFVSGI